MPAATEAATAAIKTVAIGDQLFQAAEPLVMSDRTTMRALRSRILFADGRRLLLEDVGRILALNSSTIRNYEYGRSFPSLPLTTLCTLLDLYQCTAHQLLAASENSYRLNWDSDTREHEIEPDKRRRNRIC